MPDEEQADAAVLMAFYKWRDTPMVQMLFSVLRTTTGTSQVAFETTQGVPLNATFDLQEVSSSETMVTVSITHGIPDCLIEEVGFITIKTHLRGIFKENFRVRCLHSEFDCLCAAQSV